MSEKWQHISSRVLWISTLAILVVMSVQALSGNWITFLFILPGRPADLSLGFIQAMAKLSFYHQIAGFAIVCISVVILIFAFIHKTTLYVRIFSALGFVITVSAVIGGFVYVTSALEDRWSLGQMADSFVGAFAAYLLQLFFMNKTPGFLLKKKPQTTAKTS
jgi:hypothetical protein